MDKKKTTYKLMKIMKYLRFQYGVKRIIPVVIGILLLAGCTERIDIELDSSYALLSVEGYITSDTTAHYVRLTTTTDYYNPQPMPPVKDAVVTIDDGTGIITLTEYDSMPGYYYTPADYFGVPGRTYNLDIQLPGEVNGKTHYTASTAMNPVAPIDSITLFYNSQFDGWEIWVYALDPPTEDFYSFQVYKNGVLQSDTINEMAITDDRFFNGSYLAGVPAYFMHGEDANFEQGDVITLKMGGITKDYFTFVAELRDETFKFRNPLFSGPPANIISNVSGGAVGYFTAYSVSYASTVFEEGE